MSVILESAFIALIGGTAGAFLAWFVFDGYDASTINWRSFSQVVFAFDVNAALLTKGVAYAVVIGMLGGLLPAIRAVRMSALRALHEE